MSNKTDSLQELYVELTDGEVLTESQEEEPSRDPIEGEAAALEQEVSEAAMEDGLDDAVAGVESADAPG